MSIHWITAQDEGINYWPVFAPDGKSVLFTHGHEDAAILLRYTLSTEEVVSFISNPPPEMKTQTRPDWSRSSPYSVAFAGNGIWLADQDGGNCRLLPGTGSMVYPSWFPGGKAMAVMDNRYNQPATKKIDLDGTVLGPLSPTDLYTGMPSVNQWNPYRIAFPGQPATGDYDENNNRVWISDDGGPTAHQLDTAQGRTPWWSPDGSLIAFESDRSGQGYAIYVATPDGALVRRLTDPAIGAQHPKWSPDGKQIVFAGKPHPGSGTKIGILSVADVP